MAFPGHTYHLLFEPIRYCLILYTLVHTTMSLGICFMVRARSVSQFVLHVYLHRDTEKKVEENMSERFIAWLLQRPNPIETENPEKELREIANRNAQNPLKCRHLGDECGGLHWPCCMINKDKPLCCSFPRGSDPFSLGRCIYKKAGIVCNRIW